MKRFITYVVLLASVLVLRAQKVTADSLAVFEVDVQDDVVPTFAEKAVTLYDLPYSTCTSLPDYKRLAWNTATFVGAGVATLLVLEMLPEDATAWNKDEIRNTSFFHRWTTHVKDGPVWDKDNPIFNNILHPYGGAVYYMSARSCGCNVLGAAAYSFFVSTMLWEYGIECFMEVPSMQDLIVTPLAGSLVGEGFYAIKRHIVAHDYHLWGSWFLGHLVAWVVDPINEFVSLFAGNPCKRGSVASQLTLQPMSRGGLALSFQLSL